MDDGPLNQPVMAMFTEITFLCVQELKVVTALVLFVTPVCMFCYILVRRHGMLMKCCSPLDDKGVRALGIVVR